MSHPETRAPTSPVAAPEAMVTALHVVDAHRARDKRQSYFELGWGTEGVTGTRDEQARQVEAPEVLGAHFVGPAGRMERVADEHEAGSGEAFGNGHAAHTPSHGAPSEEDPLRLQGSAGSK